MRVDTQMVYLTERNKDKRVAAIVTVHYDDLLIDSIAVAIAIDEATDRLGHKLAQDLNEGEKNGN